MGRIYTTFLTLFTFLSFSTASTTLFYGDDLTAWFNTLGESHTYTFDATSGDVILLRMRGTSGGVDACMELFDPSGASIGLACDDGGIVFFDGMALATSGTYTLETHDHDNNDTGEYGLSLTLLNNPINTVPIICTTDLMGKLEHQTEVDAYSYTGNAGDIMVIQMRAVQRNIESQLRLYSPSGNLLSEALPTYGFSRINAFVLPETGTYTVLCMDKNGNDLGDYGFSIQWINADDCAVELECGVGQTASLDFIAQMHAYRIDINGGDRIYLRMRGEAGIEAELELYDPTGTMVATDSPSSGIASIENYQATSSGTYFVMVRDQKGNDTGSYGIIYRNLSDDACSVLIECEADLNDSLGQLADLDVFRFEGAAGEKFWIQGRNTNVSVEQQLECYDAAGNQLAIDISSGGLASLEEITLPADGEYFIFVCDKSGNDLGDYGFGFQQLTNANCAASFSCSENSITGTIDKMASIQSYSLSGKAGDVISIDMVEESAGLEPLLCICAPDGSIIVDETASQDLHIENFVLPQTGDYLLLAMDRNGNDLGSYTLTVNGGVAFTDKAPIPTIETLLTLRADCEITLEIPIATDACSGIVIFGFTDSQMTFDEQGTYTVVWAFTDQNGNITIQQQIVIIEDNKVPTTYCEDIILTLDETGYASIDESTLMGESYDECGLYSPGSAPLEFTCDDVGTNPVSFALTDVHGNTANCNLTIFIEESAACITSTCGDLPENWSDESIGSNSGETCYDPSQDMYQVNSLGGDIYGTDDDFQFAYQSLNGSYYVKAKLTEINSTQEFALAGLMMRKQINNNGSRNAGLFVTPEGKLILQGRSQQNKSTYVNNDLGTVSLPIWLKLEYKNKKVVAYTSDNGGTWNERGAASVNLNGNFYAGMAVSSFNDEDENLANFQYAQADLIPNNFTGNSGLQPGTPILEETCNDEVENREDSGNCNNERGKAKKEEKEIYLYPNPAIDQVSLDMKDFAGQNVDIMIMNLAGKVVWQTKKKVTLGEHVNINLLDIQLEQGYYRMSIRSGKNITSKPVFIMRPED